MEILANLDDINQFLDQTVAEATNENTSLIQVGVARVIRGNLYPVIDQVILQGWRTPNNTPEIIRELAGMFIAAQHYYNEWSKTNNIIDDDSYPQRLYDRAIALLRQILSGEIIIPDVPIQSTGNLTADDFFPVDDTDRAFTRSMEL